MRFLSAIVGALLGAVAGLVIGLLVAVLISGNELFAAGFIAIYAGPTGLLVGVMVGAISSLRLLPYLRENELDGRIRAKRLLFLLTVVIGGTAMLIGLLVLIIRSDITPPTDHELLANFERHETTFRKLIEMLKADKGLTRVDVDWTDPNNPETIGVSPARIATYRRMLKDAHVPRGFEARGDFGGVGFLYWGIGSAVSSDTTKGYAYMTTPPIDLLSSLDGYQPDRENTVRVYRHIRGNWYLFYEYLPG